jgi:serine/threonine-protein kinase
MHEGRVLAGKYRLLSKLTAGGMGSVWRAEHVELGSPAAVKLLEPTIADSAEALARFKREAQSSASLRSSNIVQVFDFGVDGHTPYIAMELLRGRSLSEVLRERKTLPPQETAMILAQVARAAAWAHSRGIVHRDLKPGNVFLSEDANDIVVKLLDFGIAKPIHMDFTVTPVTLAGAIMGTPQYMSPEQASGRREVDHRTDIWAFAVIAFECLTGRHAFQADTLGGLVLAICTEPMPIPSEHGNVPEGFDEWFARATERDPDERFQDITEAGEALLAVCGGDPTSSRPLRLPGEFADLLPTAAPLTPRTRVQYPFAPDATTTMHSGFVTRKLKLAIFVGLFGTGAAAAALLHFSSERNASAARAASVRNPFASHTSAPPSPNSPAPESRQASSLPSPTPSNASSDDTHAKSAPPANVTGKKRRSASDHKSASMLSMPFAPSPSARAPLVPASAPESQALPAPASPCDPGMKNKLGFCPRPGK